MNLNEVVKPKTIKYHTAVHKTTVKKSKKVKPLKVVKSGISQHRTNLIKPLHYYMQKIYKSAF